MKFKTISEIYINDIEIGNIESSDLERNRNFMSKNFNNQEEVTEFPTSETFTFSLGGTLDINDDAHMTFLFDFPKEKIELKYYLGRKSEGLGFILPVYIESIAPTHSGEGTVDFLANFKAAGPIIPILV